MIQWLNCCLRWGSWAATYGSHPSWGWSSSSFSREVNVVSMVAPLIFMVTSRASAIREKTGTCFVLKATAAVIILRPTKGTPPLHSTPCSRVGALQRQVRFINFICKIVLVYFCFDKSFKKTSFKNLVPEMRSEFMELWHWKINSKKTSWLRKVGNSASLHCSDHRLHTHIDTPSNILMLMYKKIVVIHSPVSQVKNVHHIPLVYSFPFCMSLQRVKSGKLYVF